MNKTYETKSPNESQKKAHDLAKNLKDYRILALYGELGSGKTTFVQGLAKGLGIKKRIISPTFIIVRSYGLGVISFYHVDLYRVESQRDLENLGLSEILNDKNNIVAIEWAEKIQKLLPKKRIDLKFENLGENKRKIKIDYG